MVQTIGLLALPTGGQPVPTVAVASWRAQSCQAPEPKHEPTSPCLCSAKHKFEKWTPRQAGRKILSCNAKAFVGCGKINNILECPKPLGICDNDDEREEATKEMGEAAWSSTEPGLQKNVIENYRKWAPEINSWPCFPSVLSTPVREDDDAHRSFVDRPANPSLPR